MAIRKNAFKFTHPDVNPMKAGLHFSLAGGVQLADDIDSVRQAVLILLTTIPGERVMRPNYGCDLYRLIFSPNDDTTAGLAMHYVRQAIQRWEPRVDILELDAAPDPDIDNRLVITLRYRIRETLRTDSLVLPLNLEGASR